MRLILQTRNEDKAELLGKINAYRETHLTHSTIDCEYVIRFMVCTQNIPPPKMCDFRGTLFTMLQIKCRILKPAHRARLVFTSSSKVYTVVPLL